MNGQASAFAGSSFESIDFPLPGTESSSEMVFQGDWLPQLNVYLGRDQINRKLAPIEDDLRQQFGFALCRAVVKRADMVAMATELRDFLPSASME